MKKTKKNGKLIISSFLFFVSGITHSYSATQKEFNASDYLKGDCITNDAPSLNQLIQKASQSSDSENRTKIIFKKPSGGCFSLENPITLKNNIELEGSKEVTLQMNGKPATVFSGAKGLSNIKISNLTIDQRKEIHPNPANIIQLNSAKNIEIDNITAINATGAFSFTESKEITIKNSSVSNSRTHGIELIKTENSQIINNTFQKNSGFGVIIADYSNNNTIQGNRTTKNGLELVGVVKTAYNNKIIGNHAEGTGDNCISISGYNNLVTGNTTQGCDGVGIFVYGKNNTITSNIVKNNNKGFNRNPKWFCGIQVRAVFGGAASGNTIIGNNIDDNQSTPSQLCGIAIKPPIYNIWSRDQKIKKDTYIQYKNNIYIAENTGITGTVPPTHNSGHASDGQINWMFSQSFPSDLADSQDNIIMGNKIGNKTREKYIIESKAKNNFVSDDEASIQVEEKKLDIKTKNQKNNQPNALELKNAGGLAGKGKNCKVNDELTIEGGVIIQSANETKQPLRIKILSVDDKGGVLKYDFLNKETTHYRIPFSNGAKAIGGNCSSPPTVKNVSWSLVQL